MAWVIIMERLRIARTKHKWTQKEVANKLGIHQSTYTKYETGDSDPSSEMLLKLAEIFEVSTDYLLGREQKEQPPAQSRGLTDVQKEAVQFIKRLSEEQLVRFINMGKAAFEDNGGKI